MDSWHSYTKVFALGHRAIEDILKDSVIVEEKVDGSQFSFGVFNGEIRIKSKNSLIHLSSPEGMFVKACEVVQLLALTLTDGWTYRAEYLQKPKHNTLVYDRIPNNHLMIFDVNTGNEHYLSRASKEIEAVRIGLEVVPLLYEGLITTQEQLMGFLDTVSVLGGQKIEGIVVKNYSRFNLVDNKAMIGKFVSEAFKEVHSKGWKDSNPSNKDMISLLIGEYCTVPRWNKAIQHLKERGELDESPRDIGNLIKEVFMDVEDECKEEIKEKLFKIFKKQIQRGVTKGLPEWYKEELSKKQFKETEVE